MSERTGIAWCDATVNFWWGCAEVSPGCDHCYARTLAKKFKGMDWGPRAPRERISSAAALARRLNRRAARSGRRLRVFTNSMSDFFDNQVDPAWRREAWAVIAECAEVDWLILTKRPQNIVGMVPTDWHAGWPHVWLGVSAENQAEADRRIPILQRTPACLRWVSAEPLLEDVDFTLHHNRLQSWLRSPWGTARGVLCTDWLPPLDWVVVGGESGAGRRDCGVDAIVNLAQQCRRARVPVFVKQDSAHRPDQQGRIPDEWFIREWPEALVGPGGA